MGLFQPSMLTSNDAIDDFLNCRSSAGGACNLSHTPRYELTQDGKSAWLDKGARNRVLPHGPLPHGLLLSRAAR